MLNGNGEFTGFRGVVHDITKRKLAQAALKESEELFRVLISSVPDLVIRTDLEGTITYINDYGLAMGGFHSPREIVGTHVSRWFAEEDLERVKENAKLMLERPLGPIEYTLIDRNGLRHALEINGDVLRAPDGTPFGMVFVGRDVTQRKMAEDAIRKAHQQITILSGITRHDILNNITVILGYLSFAKAKGNVPPEMNAFIERIEEKTRQIREQIEFTRIYEDIGSTEPKWQDIHAVVQGVSIPQGVRITETCDGIEVYADIMLKTVFANLIDNSVRHGERVTEIRIAPSEKEGRLVIIYEDNGAGIAKEEKEMIFERGFGKHTGLGLFLAREVLALTGITITENGTPGKGARFIITVPKGEFRIASGR
jgi:PAS domain S-box-containing protein